MVPLAAQAPARGQDALRVNTQAGGREAAPFGACFHGGALED